MSTTPVSRIIHKTKKNVNKCQPNEQSESAVLNGFIVIYEYIPRCELVNVQSDHNITW